MCYSSILWSGSFPESVAGDEIRSRVISIFGYDHRLIKILKLLGFSGNSSRHFQFTTGYLKSDNTSHDDRGQWVSYDHASWQNY